MTKLGSSHFDIWHMFVTFQHYYVWQIATSIYVHHIAMTRLCSSHCDVCICSSHCDMTMLVMIGLCSSQFNDRSMFVTLWHLCMFHTLRWQGYVQHIVTSILVCHIVTLLQSLSCEIHVCLSHCKERDMLIRFRHMHMFVTLQHYYVYDDRSVFITLWWEGYVCRNMMFFYVHHIARTRLCSSHCDICICLSHLDITMFVMIGLCLSHYYVCDHRSMSKCDVRISLSHCDDVVMFITLQCFYMFITLWCYYVWYIARLLCLTHFDVWKSISNCGNRYMCITLQRQEMFITLR